MFLEETKKRNVCNMASESKYFVLKQINSNVTLFTTNAHKTQHKKAPRIKWMQYSMLPRINTCIFQNVLLTDSQKRKNKKLRVTWFQKVFCVEKLYTYHPFQPLMPIYKKAPRIKLMQKDSMLQKVFHVATNKHTHLQNFSLTSDPNKQKNPFVTMDAESIPCCYE